MEYRNVRYNLYTFEIQMRQDFKPGVMVDFPGIYMVWVKNFAPEAAAFENQR